MTGGHSYLAGGAALWSVRYDYQTTALLEDSVSRPLNSVNQGPTLSEHFGLVDNPPLTHRLDTA